jgi:insulysin
MLRSPHFDSTGWKKAKWYGTEHQVTPLSTRLLELLNNLELHPDLSLPAPNNFIAEDFTLMESPIKGPKVIVEDETMRMWYKKDDTYLVPRAHVFLDLRSPIAYQNARASVLTRLYVDLLSESMNEFAYDAEIADLGFNLSATTTGITLSLNGFNDKMHVLLQYIIGRMKGPFSESDFVIVKERLHKIFTNWFKDSPSHLAMYFVTMFTQEKIYRVQEKLDNLPSITLKELEEFFGKLLQNLHVHGFAFGNLCPQNVEKLVQIVKNGLLYEHLPLEQRFREIGVMLVPKEGVTKTLPVFDKDNLNSAIEYCLQVGPIYDDYSRIMLNVFAQLANEPVFDMLRTKQQLGYLVFGGIRKENVLSFRVIIQSEKHPVFLEERIVEFLAQMEVLFYNTGNPAANARGRLPAEFKIACQ